MIAEGPLLEALEGVHSGRLRPMEAYRQIRAAETTSAVGLSPSEAAVCAAALRAAMAVGKPGWTSLRIGMAGDLAVRLEAAS